MTLTEFEKEMRMKRNQGVIQRVVRTRLAKTKRIVHGGRAQNIQLPRHLERPTKDWDVFADNPRKAGPTKDWDVFADNPRKAAMNMDKALDKKFRGNLFHVKKGIGSPGIKVFKVKSKVTGEGIVDYASTKEKIPWIAKRGKRFATLKQQVNRAKENLKDPEKKFRAGKDRSLVRRYNKFKKGGKK